MMKIRKGDGNEIVATAANGNEKKGKEQHYEMKWRTKCQMLSSTIVMIRTERRMK